MTPRTTFLQLLLNVVAAFLLLAIFIASTSTFRYRSKLRKPTHSVPILRHNLLAHPSKINLGGCTVTTTNWKIENDLIFQKPFSCCGYMMKIKTCSIQTLNIIELTLQKKRWEKRYDIHQFCDSKELDSSAR